jgi:glycosyltransferase involved in cell wall biosynthesis
MVSIIVPVYNVAPYLRDCLDSIISQTFTDWEGILVDDGSTDESGAICDEYAARDQRFRVIHQTNIGLTGVRNVGLKEARGEFIAWVDSDDMVHPKWLETQHDIITTHDCDIAVVEYRNCFNGLMSDADVAIKDAEFIPLCHAIDNVLNSGIKGFNSSVCDKMYRKAFIGDSTFVIDRAEDLDFNLQMILKGAKIYSSPTPLYYYRLRSDSITSGKNHDTLLKDIVVRCNVYDHYLTLDKEQKYKPIILESIYQHLLYAKNYPVYNNTSASPSDETYYQEVYRRTLAEFKSSDGVSRGMKIKVWLVRHLPNLYFWMVKSKKKFIFRY